MADHTNIKSTDEIFIPKAGWGQGKAGQEYREGEKRGDNVRRYIIVNFCLRKIMQNMF